ncbi:Vacuolar protein-sorting-associated protein 28 [Rhodotorula kratochvilovae]
MSAATLAFNLDEEVRLATSNADRERIEELANLYSLVVSLNYLERAYVRDSITASQYAPACTRLLAQYKTIMKLVGDAVPSLDAFMQEYRMDCTAAAHRLRVGVPATVEHSAEEGGAGGAETAKWVAETTQGFITFMDALKLKLRAKDQLHPLLTDLMSGYTRFKNSNEWEGRPKILHWLITLNQMRASEEITEEQSRQMLFDVEHAYSEFFRSLSSAR